MDLRSPHLDSASWTCMFIWPFRTLAYPTVHILDISLPQVLSPLFLLLVCSATFIPNLDWTYFFGPLIQLRCPHPGLIHYTYSGPDPMGVIQRAQRWREGEAGVTHSYTEQPSHFSPPSSLVFASFFVIPGAERHGWAM